MAKHVWQDRIAARFTSPGIVLQTDIHPYVSVRDTTV